jgi:hypothetical protein
MTEEISKNLQLPKPVSGKRLEWLTSWVGLLKLWVVFITILLSAYYYYLLTSYIASRNIRTFCFYACQMHASPCFPSFIAHVECTHSTCTTRYTCRSYLGLTGIAHAQYCILDNSYVWATPTLWCMKLLWCICLAHLLSHCWCSLNAYICVSLILFAYFTPRICYLTCVKGHSRFILTMSHVPSPSAFGLVKFIYAPVGFS